MRRSAGSSTTWQPSTPTERLLWKLSYVRHLQAETGRLKAERLRTADVFDTLGYEPNCRSRFEARKAGVPEEELPPPCGQCPQELFHAASEYDVLYGGAAGGGKSRALLMEALRACARYPGIRVGAFRRTYDELAESLLAELEKVSYAEALGAKWDQTRHDLYFPPYRRGGSVIRFRFLERLSHATKRQGGQYQLIVIDERTLIAPGIVPVLMERLRTDPATGIPVLGVRSGSNPGGPGHGEAKARYVDATDHGAKVAHDAQGTIRFIPARVDDNPHVDPGYRARLEAIPDPHRRAAMLDGSWDSFAGQYFPEWRRERHCTRPFPVPAQWRRLNGIDYGYAAPWAVLWAAEDGDGRVWVYRELYKTGVGEKEQARRILAAEAEGEQVSLRAADPSMWAKAGDATPIAHTYAAEGVQLTKADNDRLTGWTRVHTYLSDGPACAIHRRQGWATCPMLHVFEATCPNLVRTLPLQVHDETRVEDLDTDGEDHGVDALRYLLVSIGGEPGWVWADQGEPPLAERAGEPILQPHGRYAIDAADQYRPRS